MAKTAAKLYRIAVLGPPNSGAIGKAALAHFIVSDQRHVDVELCDCASDLLNGHVSEEELAHRLRPLVRHGDGLLLLTEAPRPGEEQTRLSDELRRLQRAFNLLRAPPGPRPAAECPIALGFTNWERRHLANGAATDEEDPLTAFLTARPAPAHRVLVDDLSAAVTPGCFRAFAVRGAGAPCGGLAAALDWIIRQRNAIDLVAAERAANQLTWASRWPWLYANALNPAPVRRLTLRARELAARFAPGTPERRRAHAARCRAARVAVLRWLTLLAALLAALLGGLASGCRTVPSSVERLDTEKGVLARPGCYSKRVPVESDRLNDRTLPTGSWRNFGGSLACPPLL